MYRLLSLMWLSSVVAIPTVAAAEDGVSIWQGISFDWTLANHRWNRIGSMVNPSWDAANAIVTTTVTATAASGTGGDVALIRTDYDTVAAEGVSFVDGSAEFDISGAMGDTLSFRRSFEIDAHLDDGYDQVQVGFEDPQTGEIITEGEPRRLGTPKVASAVALLNGFDLLAIGSPKKPELFSIEASDVVYDEIADTLGFDIDVDIRMDCTSIECRTDDLDYELIVRWVVVYESADDDHDALHLTHRNGMGVEHTWNIWTAPTPAGFMDDITGVAGMEAATVGIRRLHMELDDEHHMVGLRQMFQNAGYDASTGRYDLEQFNHFRQWQYGMPGIPFPPFVIPISYPDEGDARFEMDLTLVQFDDARVVNHARTLLLDWPGGDASADTSAAIVTSTQVDAF